MRPNNASEEAAPPEARPTSTLGRGRSFQVLKAFAYFIMLGVGAAILREIFKTVSTTASFAELSRLSGLAANNLDVTKNIDDLIVTFFALAVAFLLVLPVAWVHTMTKGDQADPALTQTLIMLAVIVAGVMLLLEDNLARSFSLVGVVAAVRYRNTLKDPKDAVYVFLALGVGMACGLQAYHVALFLSFFECTILLVLWAYRTGAPPVGDANLLQTLIASEKKGQRTPAEALAWLTPEARARLEAEVATQSHYITLAAMFAKKSGAKRPNCVLTVEITTGSGVARNYVNAELEDHRGNWRLVGSEEKGAITVLEYLGRLPRKRTPPMNLLDRLRKVDPAVHHVAFRSLRKMLSSEAASNDAVHALKPVGEPPVDSLERRSA